jgi:hypothetical protein
VNRTGISVFVFAALVAFAVTGDVKGWFDTPLHLGTDENQSQNETVDRLAAKARQSCRFGAALVRAQVREGRAVRTQKMADAYVDAIAGLDTKQRALVRKACIKGLELGFQ